VSSTVSKWLSHPLGISSMCCKKLKMMENHFDFILDELLKQGPWGGGSRWFWLSLATTADKKSGTLKII
jgi:hypothetical protein